MSLAGARAAALAVALGLAACGPGPVGAPAGPTFTVGGITFRVASAGLERGSSDFTLWMTDHVDTCAAIVGTPVQTTTFWKLRVAPPASGPGAAGVVAPKLAPAPGEAIGRLEQRTGGVAGMGFDAADGSLSWSTAADGSITLTAFDVGFAGTTDRMTGGGLRFRACN